MKLFRGPVKRRNEWLDWVNQPLTVDELDAVRLSLIRGRTYGTKIGKTELQNGLT